MMKSILEGLDQVLTMVKYALSGLIGITIGAGISILISIGKRRNSASML